MLVEVWRHMEKQNGWWVNFSEMGLGCSPTPKSVVEQALDNPTPRAG